MNELLNIQNDLLLACLLITFIALTLAGMKIALQLYRGETVDDRLFNWLGGIALVLGVSYMLTSFLNG